MSKPIRRKHKQAALTLFNQSEVLVDYGVRELVSIMNAPGLRTLNSCENDLGTGYVQFRGKLAKPFAHSMLRQWLNAKGSKPLDGVTFANPKNPKWPDSFSIRWNPGDFDRVVRYARIALRTIRSPAAKTIIARH
jgi:hypothetical protein